MSAKNTIHSSRPPHQHSFAESGGTSHADDEALPNGSAATGLVAAFDAMTRLAAHLLEFPMVLLVAIRGDAYQAASRFGIAAADDDQFMALVGDAIWHRDDVISNSPRAELRTIALPSTASQVDVGFCASIPLRTDNHVLAGMLFLFDRAARNLSDVDPTHVRDISVTARELLHQWLNGSAKSSAWQPEARHENAYYSLVEQSPHALLIFQNELIRFANRAALSLLGTDRLSDIVGKPFPHILAQGYRDVALRFSNGTPGTATNRPTIEQRWLRTDGTPIDVEATFLPIDLDGNSATQVIAKDLSANERLIEPERMSTHDILTGLPNRALLMDRLYQGVAHWQKLKKSAIVALINLDHFKELNETFGHLAGDKALVAIARYLSSCVQKGDTVARIGADEFAVILEDADGSRWAREILQGLMKCIEHPIPLDAQEVTVTASIGYSRYPQDGFDADMLLNAASAALRRAKNTGRANVQPYTPDIRIKGSHRLTLEGKLRHAVKRNELILHYQPKISIRTGRIIGMEALVRWDNPDMGFLSPTQFIPVAEQTGLIVPIGESILRSACEQIRQWNKEGLPHLPVAVNLSSRQFLHQDIAVMVRDAIEASGIAAASLELELTESMSMDNPIKSIATMETLKALGVALSIDDFGTGYSSLSYLKRFPIDTLKIDQSFIKDMTQSAEALTIVQAIIAMAHRLRLQVVAEGVETEKQLSFLALNLCDAIQGNYYSVPLSATDCTELLRAPPQLKIDQKSQLAIAALFGCR